MSGGVLPDEFLTPDQHGVCGGIELGFMSTTTNRKVALEYAAGYDGGTDEPSYIFEMNEGLVNRGADVSWVSQYPGENEKLFPPLCALNMEGHRIEGSVCVITLGITQNQQSMTMEQLRSRRQLLLLNLNKHHQRILAAYNQKFDAACALLDGGSDGSGILTETKGKQLACVALNEQIVSNGYAAFHDDAFFQQTLELETETFRIAERSVVTLGCRLLDTPHEAVMACAAGALSELLQTYPGLAPVAFTAGCVVGFARALSAAQAAVQMSGLRGILVVLRAGTDAVANQVAGHLDTLQALIRISNFTSHAQSTSAGKVASHLAWKIITQLIIRYSAPRDMIRRIDLLKEAGMVQHAAAVCNDPATTTEGKFGAANYLQLYLFRFGWGKGDKDLLASVDFVDLFHQLLTTVDGGTAAGVHLINVAMQMPRYYGQALGSAPDLAKPMIAKLIEDKHMQAYIEALDPNGKFHNVKDETGQTPSYRSTYAFATCCDGFTALLTKSGFDKLKFIATLVAHGVPKHLVAVARPGETHPDAGKTVEVIITQRGEHHIEMGMLLSGFQAEGRITGTVPDAFPGLRTDMVLISVNNLRCKGSATQDTVQKLFDEAKTTRPAVLTFEIPKMTTHQVQATKMLKQLAQYSEEAKAAILSAGGGELL